MYKNKELIGEEFWYWKIINIFKWNNSYVICKCICGKEKIVNLYQLRHNKTKSCGCKKKRKERKPIKLQVKEYSVWRGMIQRCYPSKNVYSLYEERGIIVCDRWLDKKNGFINFYKDMGKRPSNDHSLDRIDNNGNYELSNCKWSTRKEKNKNKSNSKYVVYKQKEWYLKDLCDELKIKYSLVNSRLYSGWTIEQAIETKPNSHNKKKRYYEKTYPILLT